MSKGVCYFNNGTKCLLRLAVSLRTLRDHYDGPVTILDGNGQEELKAIASDSEADIKPVQIRQLRRHTAYSAKPAAVRQSPYDTTVFMDADTTVHGAIDELFNLAPQTCVVLTQMSDWMTDKPMIAERIYKFWGLRGDVNHLIEKIRVAPMPAINTGVLAVHGTTAVESWETVTQVRFGEFIADEIGMQIAFAGMVGGLVLTDEWNYSPIYGKSKDPRIVHYHGKKHTRPEALSFWHEPFLDTWHSNFGNIQALAHWDPALKDPNKLKELT